MGVRWAEMSDVGLVRSRNQDAVLCRADPTGARGVLLVVADGMGGQAAGEVASRMAVDTVADVYFGATDAPAAVLHQALTEANRRIAAASVERADARGMGTTCVALAVIDGSACVLHVGDSRAYHLRGSALARLTRDESVWAAQVRAGESPANAYGRNQLVQAVGTEIELELQPPCEVAIEVGDRFLLCSDGLWGVVTDPELAAVAADADLDEACRRLVALANARGGQDNVTVVLAEVTSDRPEVSRT